jgi:acetolactate synthase-1/2/3 large subunit
MTPNEPVAMRVANAIVEFLRAAGVSSTYGVVGESVLDFVDAVGETSGVEYTAVRHEQAGALAASGFARSTAEPAVCIGHVGAGASNLVNGMADAYKDDLPVVALTGNAVTEDLGRDVWHEVDHLTMFEPVTDWNVRIDDPGRTPQIMREAMNRLNTGAPGPIHIDLPSDVAAADLPPDAADELPAALAATPEPGPPRNRVAPAPDRVDAAVDRFLDARNPIVLAGGGALTADADDALESLVEYARCPLLTSLTARGVVSEYHDYCFGALGTLGRIAAKSVADDADFVLALGTGLSDIETFNFSLFADSDIVQVSLDEGDLARQYSVDEAVLANPATFTSAFESTLRERTDGQLSEPPGMDEYRAEYRDELVAITDPDPEALSDTEDGLVSPYVPLTAIAEAKEPNDLVCSASGKNTLWSSLVPIEESGTFLKSVGLGTMGFAFPAGIGAQTAHPDATVYAIIGDGDFSMVAQELETCVREELPLVVVVFNDDTLSSIKVQQADSYGGRYIGVDYTSVDFATVAEGFGATGIRVESGAEFHDALETARRTDGPVVIDTTIDPSIRAPSLFYET